MSSKCIIILSIFCCVGTAYTQGLKSVLKQAEIEKIVFEVMKDKKILGASVGIAVNNRIKFNKGFGFTDNTKTKKVKAETVFGIASITKFITAIGVLMLDEQGKLSIDDPITKHFPQLPDEYSKIKIKHLLNHTSGLEELTSLVDELNRKESKNIRNETIFQYLTRDRIKSEPKAVWEYSNTPGYLLLSLLVEKVSEKSYGEFLKENFVETLKLKKTGLCSEEPFRSEYKLTFFVKNPIAEFLDNSKILEQLAGQGGICSTTEDLIKIVLALEAEKLIKKETVQSMQNPTVLKDGTEIKYGFGTRLGFSNYLTKYGHTGGVYTNFSTLVSYPSKNLVIAVLTNSEPSNAPRIAEKISRTILKLKEPKKVKLDKIKYEGKYQWGNYTVNYQINDSGNLLETVDYGDETQSLEFYYIGNHRFHNSEFGTSLEFGVKNGEAETVQTFNYGIFTDTEIAVSIKE